MIILDDVKKARERIMDTCRTTPLLTSAFLSKACGNQIYLKSEHLQKTGSFKLRGATNKVKQAAIEGAKYITAASSGNHGQAVAYICQELGIPAKIVVPEDANNAKMNAILNYQGMIEKCGTTSNERIPRAIEIANEEGGVYIPPYDDPYIIAGQGTIGLEILEQLSDVSTIVVPIGGGGLISGILTAIKEQKPHIKVIGVEPESANDTYLSIQNKEITSISGTNTVADGLRTSQPGALTFPIVQKYVDEVVLVTEEEIKHAFAFVLERMKQLVEPSSATTIAAVLNQKLNLRDEKIVTVISGGNVDIKQINHFL
jgi:threonine ammonia-lyase medium form